MERVFEIGQTGRLREGSAAELLDGTAKPEAPLWVDLTEPSPEQLVLWFDALAIPDFFRDLATGPDPKEILGDPSSAALVNDDGALFFFSLYGGEDVLPQRLTGIGVQHAILTFHATELPMLVAAQRLALRGDVVPAPHPAGLVAALARFAANLSAETATQLRKKLAETSTRLAKNEGETSLEELLELDASVQALSATVEGQLASTRALSVGHRSPLDLESVSEHINVTTTNLETLSRASDRLDRHMESLRAQYDSRLAERTNRRLATLTVLSAVFMPLTLLAGIYGMNFQTMPELALPWGYPAVLLLMIVIAVAMLVFFWKRGWFE